VYATPSRSAVTVNASKITCARTLEHIDGTFGFPARIEPTCCKMNPPVRLPILPVRYSSPTKFDDEDVAENSNIQSKILLQCHLHTDAIPLIESVLYPD